MRKDHSKSVGQFRKITGVIGFLRNDRPSFLPVAGVTLLAAGWMSGIFHQWTNWEAWDMFLTLFTLTVGLAVFCGEAIEDWEDRLTKRLTVFFQVDGVTRMVCYQAHLPHEGDIRNWGQQIGRQMCGGEPLEFSPYLDLKRLGVEREDDTVFTHFQATIFLKKIPTNLEPELAQKKFASDGNAWCKVLRAGEEGKENVQFEYASDHIPR